MTIYKVVCESLDGPVEEILGLRNVCSSLLIITVILLILRTRAVARGPPYCFLHPRELKIETHGN